MRYSNFSFLALFSVVVLVGSAGCFDGNDIERAAGEPGGVEPLVSIESVGSDRVQISTSADSAAELEAVLDALLKPEAIIDMTIDETTASTIVARDQLSFDKMKGASFETKGLFSKKMYRAKYNWIWDGPSEPRRCDQREFRTLVQAVAYFTAYLHPGLVDYLSIAKGSC